MSYEVDVAHIVISCNKVNVFDITPHFSHNFVSLFLSSLSDFICVFPVFLRL